MALSDTACKNSHRNEKAKAGKAFKLYDEKGLFLLLKPQNEGWGKWWRFKYKFAGKENTISFGVYPEISLAQAREKRDEARKQIAAGIDPSDNRKAVKASKAANTMNSFEVIALEWGSRKVESWDAKNNKSKRRLERFIFPWLGGRPINEIMPKDILQCLRRIEDQGAIETAHRTLQVCSQVFRYAVATGRADRDITNDLKGALPPVKSKHMSAITEPREVGHLLRAIDGYQGSLPVICALKLAPLVFVRPGELRAMEWSSVDLNNKEWRYFVSKTQVQHIVPLSLQAIEILKELYPLTGRGRYAFPSERTPSGQRCMSENTINAALKRLGYGKDVMTAHGFRAMARTILDEVLGVRPDFIEHQLAHAVRDPNGRAYNRTAHLAERHKMMQQWADYLDTLKAGNL